MIYTNPDRAYHRPKPIFATRPSKPAMFHYQIDTEIEIAASAAKVWVILSDFAAYPVWNPFVHAISGEAKVGSSLQVHIQAGKTMKFQPTVVTVEPERELKWLGRVLIPGLFDGEHRFTIDPLAADKIRFRHCERFSGLLIPLFAAGLQRDVLPGFAAMNQAQKDRAEQQ